MRLLAGFLALLLLAVTIPSSDAVGGVLVTGAGIGNTYAPNGQPFCSGHLFSVQAIYLPGGSGMLRVAYLPGASCPLSNGGATYIGYSNIKPSAVPPLEIGFVCSGTEASGMYCSGEDSATGSVSWAQVGPYSGLGSSVSIVFWEPDRHLRGSFTAV